MQTHTWMPAPATARRPSWLEVIGWYFAGGAGTGLCWSLVQFATSLTSARSVVPFAQVLGLVWVVALVMGTRRLHRRCRIAIALGAITPLLLVAALIAYLIWAFAHSNWQF